MTRSRQIAGGEVMAYASPVRTSTPGRRSSTPATPKAGRRPPVHGIQRHEAPVTGARKNRALGRWARAGPQRNATVRLIAACVSARLRVVAPVLATRVAVDRDHDAGRRGDVHAPVGKHGARLDTRHLPGRSRTVATAEVPGVVGPRGGQSGDVLARDVGERREPRAVVNHACAGSEPAPWRAAPATTARTRPAPCTRHAPREVRRLRQDRPIRSAPFTGASYHPCLAAGASHCGAPRVRSHANRRPVLACVISEAHVGARRPQSERASRS